MADPGIKNVIVKKQFLDKVTGLNEVVTRFRVVAEDKNRKSAWSKSYSVTSEAIVPKTGDVNIVGNTVIVNWSYDQSSVKTMYDIFAKFDNNPAVYIDSTSASNFSFVKSPGAQVIVTVQRASIKPELNPSLVVYSSVAVETVSTLDGGGVYDAGGA
jgi:hypothetical protein